MFTYSFSNLVFCHAVLFISLQISFVSVCDAELFISLIFFICHCLRDTFILLVISREKNGVFKYVLAVVKLPVSYCESSSLLPYKFLIIRRMFRELYVICFMCVTITLKR